MAGYTLTTASGQTFALGSSMNVASYTPISSTGAVIGATTPSYYEAIASYPEITASYFEPIFTATSVESASGAGYSIVPWNVPVAIASTPTGTLYTAPTGHIEVTTATGEAWWEPAKLADEKWLDKGESAIDWKKWLLIGLVGFVLLKKVRL